jgi:hypothetical protein
MKNFKLNIENPNTDTDIDPNPVPPITPVN